MAVEPAVKAYVNRRISQVVSPAINAAIAAVQQRAVAVTLPALTVGANIVTASWTNPMPDNIYLTIACYAGNSAFPDLSGVVVAVMPDTQTTTSVDIRVTNTTASQIGAGRKVNVYAIHGGGGA